MDGKQHMSDGGKGSAPRPIGVDWDKFEESWDKIFGPKKVKVSGVPYEVEEDKLPKKEEKSE